MYFSLLKIDKDTTQITAAFAEKQKSFSKYVEHMSNVTEMSKQLEKCTALITNSINMAKFLNDCLPEEEQLEPLNLEH